MHAMVQCSCTVWCVLQELSADEVIDYTTQRFEDVLKGNSVDAVIDPMGGEDHKI